MACPATGSPGFPGPAARSGVSATPQLPGLRAAFTPGISSSSPRRRPAPTFAHNRSFELRLRSVESALVRAAELRKPPGGQNLNRVVVILRKPSTSNQTA